MKCCLEGFGCGVRHIFRIFSMSSSSNVYKPQHPGDGSKVSQADVNSQGKIMTAACKYSLLPITYVWDCQDLFFSVCVIWLVYRTVNLTKKKWGGGGERKLLKGIQQDP